MSKELTPKQRDAHLPSTLPALPPLPVRPQSLRQVAGPLVALVAHPQLAWTKPEVRSASFREIFGAHVYFYAAIPAVSGFVGWCVFDGASIVHGTYVALSGYIFSVAFMYLATLLAKHTAPFFGGRMSLDEAAQLIVFSFMPFFVCGGFLALPSTRFLAVAGVYSLYVLYCGLQHMTHIISPQQQLTFYVVNAVAWLFYAELALVALGFH